MEQATNNPYQSPQFPDEPHEFNTPETERERQRLTYQLCRLGFGLLSGALVVASVTSVLGLLFLFMGRGGVGNQIMESAIWKWSHVPVVWGSLIGAYLLWGRWKARAWQRRSGLLLLMCIVDAALWFLEHANEFGLHEGRVDYLWLRNELGEALGWAEFALLATLSCQMLAHLGVEQAPEAGKATRSLAATGAVVWMIFFLQCTDWRNLGAQDHPRIRGAEGVLLYFGTHMIFTLVLIQVTALTIAATRQLNRVLLEMDREDREPELLRSSSELGEPPGKKPQSNRDSWD